MTTTINLADLPKIIWEYVKAAIRLAVVAFIGLYFVKLYGFDPIGIPSMEPHYFAALVAGSAYALRTL